MRLLVSVVDAAEARLAVAGGVDVVDVKNPAEGSLGAPAPAVSCGCAPRSPPSCRSASRSATCPRCPGTAALAALGAARSGADYVKVGLWGASTADEAVAVLRAAREAVDGVARSSRSPTPTQRVCRAGRCRRRPGAAPRGRRA